MGHQLIALQPLLRNFHCTRGSMNWTPVEATFCPCAARLCRTASDIGSIRPILCLKLTQLNDFFFLRVIFISMTNILLISSLISLMSMSLEGVCIPFPAGR